MCVYIYIYIYIYIDYYITKIFKVNTFPCFDAATVRDKCPNKQFFLVCIFPHSDWIWREEYLSALSPNAGKYGPEKAPYLDTSRSVSYGFHNIFEAQVVGFSEPYQISRMELFAKIAAFNSVLNSPGRTSWRKKVNSEFSLYWVWESSYQLVFNSFVTEVLLFRNESIDLQRKSMEWFVYDRDLRQERVKWAMWWYVLTGYSLLFLLLGKVTVVKHDNWTF